MANFLYSVRGSEDGVIAICTSPKRAVEVAKAYVEQIEGNKAVWNCSYDLAAAVHELSRKTSPKFYVCIESIVPGDREASHGSASCDVDKFEANYYHGFDTPSQEG